MQRVGVFILLLCLIVWVGAIIFFSFVTAPALFSALSSSAAGRLVGPLLTALHRMGLVCGIVMLAASFLCELRHLQLIRGLTALMLLATAFSFFVITPQMQKIRETVGGSIEALPSRDAGRAAFDRLHRLSVGLEVAVLASGIGIAGLLACGTNIRKPSA